MKLVHLAALFVTMAAISGCAAAEVRARETARAPVTVTAAEWSSHGESVESPRVGKAQRAEEVVDTAKEPRRFDRRSGSGFSGWK